MSRPPPRLASNPSPPQPRLILTETKHLLEPDLLKLSGRILHIQDLKIKYLEYSDSENFFCPMKADTDILKPNVKPTLGSKNGLS